MAAAGPPPNVDALLQQVSYQFPGRVKTDVMSLLSRTRALRPQVGTFVHNNGAVSRLLVLTGTFPIQYLGTQYNIPVDAYLLESYPETPPVLYVRPTPNMMVKPNHRYVDPNGLIRVPYLSPEAWRASSSTLPGLLEEMSAIYSREPPLFTKPPGYVPPSGSGASGYAASSTTSGGGSVAVATVLGTVSSGTGGVASTAIPPPPYGASPAASSSQAISSSSSSSSSSGGYVNGVYGFGGAVGRGGYEVSSVSGGTSSAAPKPQQQPSTYNTASRQPAVSRREELTSQVTAKLQHELHTFYSKVRDEIDEEFKMQTKLESRYTAAKARASELRRLASDLDQQRERTVAARSALQAWADEMKSANPISAEDRVTAYDAATAQLVNLQAAVASIDDALYFAERALANRANVASKPGPPTVIAPSGQSSGGGGVVGGMSGGVPGAHSNESLSPTAAMDVASYMREVRRLSRQQFLDRLLISKIQTAIRAEQQ